MQEEGHGWLREHTPAARAATHGTRQKFGVEIRNAFKFLVDQRLQFQNVGEAVDAGESREAAGEATVARAAPLTGESAACSCRASKACTIPASVWLVVTCRRHVGALHRGHSILLVARKQPITHS